MRTDRASIQLSGAKALHPPGLTFFTTPNATSAYASSCTKGSSFLLPTEPIKAHYRQAFPFSLVLQPKIFGLAFYHRLDYKKGGEGGLSSLLFLLRKKKN